MNNQEKIKELEYLNNEHRGVIGILMDEREVLRTEIKILQSLLKENQNEPVAWIDAKTGKPKMKGWVITDHDIPLYTHPVKELTDEEIGDIWVSMLTDTREEIIEFARAILRKASEK